VDRVLLVGAPEALLPCVHNLYTIAASNQIVLGLWLIEKNNYV